MAVLAASFRYLDPAHVTVAGFGCEKMRVEAAAGQMLGALKGFVVDPVARQLKYFVVRSRGWLGRTALVPADSAQIDLRQRVIRLNAEEAEVRRTAISTYTVVQPFTDDDLMTMLFGARAS